jgi:exodeoxyribonuclease VII small subunit
MAKKHITYAQALEEIQEISTLLESGNISVDELTSQVKRASELIQWCRQRLRATEEEIESTLDQLEE